MSLVSGKSLSLYMKLTMYSQSGDLSTSYISRPSDATGDTLCDECTVIKVIPILKLPLTIH